jgi:hypothetical protein
MADDKKEVFLEADKEVPGQKYVCLSFISPNKVLADKNQYFFTEFMKDYEIQYRVKATESFIMARAAKVQDQLAKAQDLLDNLLIKSTSASVEDLSGVVATIKEMRVAATAETSAALEEHVRANQSDFTATAIEDAYETYMFKNKKKLEERFYEKNEFRTTVQGLKVRGSYDTYGEATARAKMLQKLDPAFNVYVGQVGFWLPWDPNPHDVADQEYADDQLNQLMKKYKENEQTRDELYAQNKINKMGSKGAAAEPKGVSAGSGGVAGGAAAAIEGIPTDLFGGDDLAIRRKREAAAAASSAAAGAASASNTISYN